MNHVSVSPTDGNGPTQGQRKTPTRVGNEPTTFGLDLRLFSLIDFGIRCIGRVLLVLGSLLKNEHTLFPVFILGVYFH